MEKTRQEKLDDLRNLIKSHDLEFGLDSTYTLEKFKIDMENSSKDPFAMEDILMKGIDNLNVLDPLVKEAFNGYRKELELLKEKMSTVDTSYTLEQFEIDMENASPEQMGDILMKGIDNLDVHDPLVKEALSEYKQEFEFLKEQMAIDVDIDCNKDIDSGSLTLYKCIKDCPIYGIKSEQNYYVKEDDVREANLARFNHVEPSDALNTLLERIKSMTPTYWVYIDSGLGTLKRKVSFGTDPSSKTGSFTEHFEKFSF